MADERNLLTTYRAATNGKVPVIPDIASGFNDRGFRLPTNHPAQPRQWMAGDGPSSTLDHLFRCVALPEVDPSLPVVMVTSWDDWNEDTGIEPIGGTPTRTDDSPSGNAYTQGYTYGGEGRSAVQHAPDRRRPPPSTGRRRRTGPGHVTQEASDGRLLRSSGTVWCRAVRVSQPVGPQAQRRSRA